MDQLQVQSGEGARVFVTRAWVDGIVPKGVTSSIVNRCCKGKIDGAVLATAEEGSYKLVVQRVEVPKPGARILLVGPSTDECNAIIEKITDGIVRMTLRGES
ncbi:MAG: hypothetical protein KBC81_02560 [Candidatus Pacebacteria bacterium]|nr:hypothetical protein [Candidatus Paceibacterota bacterium]